MCAIMLGLNRLPVLLARLRTTTLPTYLVVIIVAQVCLDLLQPVFPSMSNIRRRRTVIGPGAPKDSVKDNVGSVQGDDSEKKRKTRPLRPVGTTAAGTRQSPLKRFLGLFFSVAIGWLGYSIIPKLSKSSILPTNYALCTHDESVYISAHEPPTQCVVVHKHVVVDTGTLEQTRMKYGDRDMLGTVARLTGGAMQGVLSDTQEEAGLKIYLLKRGQAVLPGLSDSHGHILEYGHSLTSVSLTGASSIQEVIRRVVQHIEALPNDKRNDYDRIIEGLGFDQTKWPGKQFPTAADLDVPQLDKRKIFLIRGECQTDVNLWSSMLICFYSRLACMLGIFSLSFDVRRTLGDSRR